MEKAPSPLSSPSRGEDDFIPPSLEGRG